MYWVCGNHEKAQVKTIIIHLPMISTFQYYRWVHTHQILRLQTNHYQFSIMVQINYQNDKLLILDE